MCTSLTQDREGLELRYFARFAAGRRARLALCGSPRDARLQEGLKEFMELSYAVDCCDVVTTDYGDHGARTALALSKRWQWASSTSERKAE